MTTKPGQNLLNENESTHEGFGQPTNPRFQKTKELARLVARGEDRRHFNRADVREKKIEVHFADEGQFARHYIDNISLGGLFIKTDKKASMGDIIPVEFSIARKSELATLGDDLGAAGTKQFHLMAKVCRITADGLGVEFLNLSHEHRRELEAYVKEVLPRNAPLVNKPKSSSVAFLEEQRLKKQDASKRNTVMALRVGFLIVMLSLNYWIISKPLEVSPMLESKKIQQSITLDNQAIEVSDIRSISLKSSSTIMVSLRDGTIIETPIDKVGRKLPPHLLHTLGVLNSVEIQKKERRSRNSGSLVRLR